MYKFLYQCNKKMPPLEFVEAKDAIRKSKYVVAHVQECKAILPENEGLSTDKKSH